MKRFAVLAVVALMSLPGAAQAQYTMLISELIAAIQIGDFNEDMNRLDGAITVYVERVSAMAGVAINKRSLDTVLARRWRALSYLRSVVRLSPVAIKALARHHEKLEDVILLTTTSDGSATLYVDDR